MIEDESTVLDIRIVLSTWAESLGTTEQTIRLMLDMMLNEPMNAPYWVTELSELRKRNDNSPAVQELADTVWERLPQAINTMQHEYDSAVREALRIALS